MNAQRPLQSISVSGDPLMARLVAALLSRSLENTGCRVTLGELDDPLHDNNKYLLGPGASKAFADLGLPPARLVEAGANPHFHWSLRGKQITSAPFGMARGGVEFHQHLHRVAGGLDFDTLLQFNPGHVIGKNWSLDQIVARSPVPYGTMIARSQLQRLLEGRTEFGAEADADFTFDVCGDGAAEWQGDLITVPSSASFPELALFRCVQAVERFLSLLPGAGDTVPMQREFNRLSLAEDECITDFASLLVGQTDRPALARKIEVFTACGRIPLEDYELFLPYQWICAFLQSGIVPKDYDRLADRIPIAETRQWLDQLRGQMDKLAKAGLA